MKLDQKRHQASEKKRHALMRIMYSDEDEKYSREQHRLELAQLRADIESLVKKPISALIEALSRPILRR